MKKLTELAEGVRVYLKSNIEECSAEDFGMTGEEWDSLMTFTLEEAIIDNVACEVDGGESDYYNITFDSGLEVSAISGYHLGVIN